MKNMKKGKFIVFEGIDGAGKTTQGNLLVDFLQQQYNAHLTQEPTMNLIGGLIRSQLTHDWKSSPECLQLLFAADRMYHLGKEILPLLEQGITVIGDRYLYSSIAYGTADGCNDQWLAQINAKATQPDLVFLLDVPPKVCIERILAERYNIALFEKEKMLEDVRTNYLKLAKQYPDFYVINGNQTKEEVHGDILKVIRRRLL